MKRIRLFFTPGVEVEFANRDAALKRIEEIAEKGTRFPIVIYGPEGCGKTALLRQAAVILDEHGYKTILASPLENVLDRALHVSPSIRDIVLEVLRSVNEPLSNLVHVAFKIKTLVEERFERSRIALLIDDLFQAVGPENAEKYVKTLLNMIEYPLKPYENIVVIISSSEGVTRERIGRHGWAKTYTLWNMDREGFSKLYNQLPGDKPPLDHVWRLTGGNPRILAKLYDADWNPETVIDEIVEEKRLQELPHKLGKRELEILEEAVEDPDTLTESAETENLLEKLVELNLVAKIPARKHHLWMDTPPPEKDPTLGIGRYVAWQTPLHREAVRKTLTGRV